MMMKSQRAQLESKLQSLVARRDELCDMLCQEQQHHQRRCSTSTAVMHELVNITDSVTDTATLLLAVASNHSDQLQDQILTLLDQVALLVTLSSETYSDKTPVARSLSTATDTSTKSHCDVVIACLITFCVLVVWLAEVSSAMSVAGCSTSSKM